MEQINLSQNNEKIKLNSERSKKWKLLITYTRYTHLKK